MGLNTRRICGPSAGHDHLCFSHFHKFRNCDRLSTSFTSRPTSCMNDASSSRAAGAGRPGGGVGGGRDGARGQRKSIALQGMLARPARMPARAAGLHPEPSVAGGVAGGHDRPGRWCGEQVGGDAARSLPCPVCSALSSSQRRGQLLPCSPFCAGDLIPTPRQLKALPARRSSLAF